MAKELAAMAKTPSGATMTVVRICAPQMTICSISHRETDTECFPERVSFQSEMAFPDVAAQFL